MHTNVFEVALLILYWLAALSCVSDVGKPRQPITSGTVIAMIVFVMIMTIGLLFW